MEPERDIEKQLKAYAKKRREDAGAPMEMHPATRRMLQSEATRMSKQKSAKSDWRQTLQRLWPRLALAGCIFALLAIGSWSLLFNRKDSESKSTLALKRQSLERTAGEPSRNAPATELPAFSKNREFKEADRSQTLSLDSPSGSATTTNGLAYSVAPNESYGFFLKDSEAANTAAPAPTAPAPAPLAQAIPTPGQNKLPMSNRAEAGKLLTWSTGSVARKRDFPASEAQVATAATATPPVAPAEETKENKAVTYSNGTNLAEARSSSSSSWSMASLMITNAYVNSARIDSNTTLGAFGGTLTPTPKLNTTTQRFARIKSDADIRTRLRDARKTTVLDNFSVEKIGDRIRIVDDDGSTYTGSVQTEFGRDSSALADESSEGLKKESEVAFANKPQRRLGAPQAVKQEAISTNNHIYSFRVSGTNLTLNESVVFTGDLFTFDDRGYLTNSLESLTDKAKAAAAPSTVSDSLTQLPAPRLRGQAIVGGTNQIRINALPVGPKK